MSPHAVSLKARAVRQIEKLGRQYAERVFERIEGLAADPRPPGSKKLKGDSGAWRIRSGDYRILYTIDDTKRTVEVVLVRHRSEAYSR